MYHGSGLIQKEPENRSAERTILSALFLPQQVLLIHAFEIACRRVFLALDSSEQIEC